MKVVFAALVACVFGLTIFAVSLTRVGKEEIQKPTAEQAGVGSVFTIHQPLADGRKVECIYVEGYQARAISCDWEHAK